MEGARKGRNDNNMLSADAHHAPTNTSMERDIRQ